MTALDIAETGRVETFEAADGSDLPLHVFAPQGPPRAAVLLFHGGGWMVGEPAMFFPQARALAAAGILAASAGYRLVGRGATSPLDCLDDARLADARFRMVAADAGLVSVGVGGGSAGGQLALSLAAPAESSGHDPLPYDALVLFNPALDVCCATDELADLLRTTFKVSAVQERELSPIHHVHAGMPPSIVFHGTDDEVVPIAVARQFRDLMTDAGNACQLVEFAGAGHGFFNADPTGDNEYYDRTLDLATSFLVSHAPRPY